LEKVGAMGGYNSSRWHWHNKKTTVEQCLSFSVRDVLGDRLPRRLLTSPGAFTGSLSWSRGADRVASVGVTLRNDTGSNPSLTLDYAVSGQRIRRDVGLVSEPMNLGGVRYYFRCPQCGRRAYKLYLPLTGCSRSFLCRTCHDLTYSSAQTAHDSDRGEFVEIKQLFDKSRRIDKLVKQLKTTRAGSRRHSRIVDKLLPLLGTGTGKNRFKGG
jgi:hypothetical protein